MTKEIRKPNDETEDAVQAAGVPAQNHESSETADLIRVSAFGILSSFWLLHFVIPSAYHLISAVPQARPAPKPQSNRWLPRLTRPAAIDSSSAMGTLPAEVFP